LRFRSGQVLDISRNVDTLVETFERERRHLLAIAFRIVASEADAEDVVQEAWLRCAAADLSGVRNIPAWLTTIVTRQCLDLLRRRRESPQEVPEMLAGDDDAPEEVALLADELSTAFVILLDELTPPQRVALVLHDAFGGRSVSSRVAKRRRRAPRRALGSRRRQTS
jgi:RNA polymerase sigma factor (sigma-70 family)